MTSCTGLTLNGDDDFQTPSRQAKSSEEVTKYRTALARLAPAILAKPEDTAWRDGLPEVTQAVLDDACSHADSFARLFPGVTMEPRPCKRVERVAQKLDRKGPDSAFKLHSDFLAFRINVEVSDIASTVAKISARVAAQEGYSHVRNAIHDPNDGRLTDIVQYMFAFVPEIGHIVELQVGHPLAAFTFARDSVLRDARSNNRSCNLPDLWTNGFYEHARAKILNPAESCNLKRELEMLYDGHEIESELRQIIESIERKRYTAEELYRPLLKLQARLVRYKGMAKQTGHYVRANFSKNSALLYTAL